MGIEEDRRFINYSGPLGASYSPFPDAHLWQDSGVADAIYKQMRPALRC